MSVDQEVLARLFETIEARKGSDAKTSYTASLLAKGPAHCARKFGEEAVETIIASMQSNANTKNQDLINESADTLYHLMVLLAAHDVSFNDIMKELARREGMSGHEEKAARE